jgi:hypothetical protein
MNIIDGNFEVLPGYVVTRDGRVFSIQHNWRGLGDRELSQALNGHGYPAIRATVNGHRKKYMVHKLVAEAFIGPRPADKDQIRHLDGTRTNNCAANLAWGTAQENADDRAKHGRTRNGYMAKAQRLAALAQSRDKP